jgi:maleate isomerase
VLADSKEKVLIARRIRIGVLTPSSNTWLEPLTTRILAGLDEVTLHFSRVRVLDISLRPMAVQQFALEPMLEAASLLEDARVDTILWSGTAGGWRGAAADRELCTRLTARSGVPSTTATLALFSAMRRLGAKSVGLVTPYPRDVQDAIEMNFDEEGFRVTRSATHAATTINYEFSEIDEPTLTRLTGDVATSHPDVISTFCTNLGAAHLVPEWEARFATPVYDSTAVAIWEALRLVGVNARRVRGWGSLFDLE